MLRRARVETEHCKGEMHVWQEAGAGASLLVLSPMNTLGLAFVVLFLFRAPSFTVASLYRVTLPVSSLHLHSRGRELT